MLCYNNVGFRRMRLLSLLSVYCHVLHVAKEGAMDHGVLSNKQMLSLECELFAF